MKEISFPATIVKSDEGGTAKLRIEKDWQEMVHSFAKANKFTPGTKIRVIFQEWSDDCTPRAFNLFHALRDRLAEAQGDESRQYKEHLKQCLKLDFGVRKEIIPGTIWLKSTSKYTTREMYLLNKGTIDRCAEEKAVYEDLLPEFQDIKNGNKNGT